MSENGRTEIEKRTEIEASDFDPLVMRPGLGWKHLAGPVWEHVSGARIHTRGLVRMPDRVTFYDLYRWRESELGWLLIKINGGNRKRGLMAWAVNLVGA